MSDIKNILDISPHKLFDVLQREYLICVLRAQIYPKQKHKDYWNKIAHMKEDKICDLKWKYKLVSIFDDEKLMKKYKLETYNEFGLPNFYYPNERVKEQQIYWDIKNYFEIGSKVRGYKFNEGTIERIFIDSKELLVKVNLDNVEVHFDEVSRIL